MSVGKMAQAVKGKITKARAPVIPLTICTLALLAEEWNSEIYDVIAENGPVNLLSK